MKKAYSLTFNGDTVKAVMPRELAQEIMRVQAQEDTDFPTACKLVAERSNSGSREFTKRVNDGALRLYRSRHFAEMNKALTTKYNEGLDAGKGYAKLYSPCAKKCGKPVVFDLCNATQREQINEMLQKGGIGTWGHVTC